MASWLVTVAKTKGMTWADYEKELEAVADKSQVLNFRVQFKPKTMAVGDRFYVIFDGFVRGWMPIHNIVFRDGFTCTTTGKQWKEGWYIQRTGVFHLLVNPVPYRGFQGYRAFDDMGVV